jgi:hypothetical protein
MEVETLQINLFVLGIGFAAGFWVRAWIATRRRQAARQRAGWPNNWP